MKVKKRNAQPWKDIKYIGYHKNREVNICERNGDWYFVIYYPGESYNSVADNLYYDIAEDAVVGATERINGVFQIKLF